MPEENLPPQVRQLTKSQLLARIPELRAAVMANAEGLTRLQVAHLVQLLLMWETFLQGELEELDDIIRLVQSADMQSELMRKGLLWDLRGYPNSSAEDRRKAKDRYFKAVVGAPPVDPKAEDLTGVVELSGHEFKQPDRFKE